MHERGLPCDRAVRRERGPRHNNPFEAALRQGTAATYWEFQGVAQASSPAPFRVDPNWSGYVVPFASTVTSASGEWVVPKADCADARDGSASEWVGTGGARASGGGYTGDLLETATDVYCLNGEQHTRAWWELAPKISIGVFSFPVHPGDTMSAEVFQIESNCTTTCGQWETIVQDLTTGLQGVMVTNDGYGVTRNGTPTFPVQHSTVGMSYAGGTTAEWVGPKRRRIDRDVRSV